HMEQKAPTPSSSRIRALDDVRILNFTKLSSDKQEKKPPGQKWNFRNLIIFARAAFSPSLSRQSN
ncbi:hypothetical protein, partial [Clostridium sp.]